MHDFLVWQEQLESVDQLGAYRAIERNLITADGRSEPVDVAEISPVAFPLTRVPPLLGRPLLEADAAPVKVAGMPPRLAPEVPRFAHIRQRVPHLRERWKNLDRPARQRLRQKALRERINWQLPARVRPASPAPRRLERNKRPGPARPSDRRPRRRQ